VDEDIISLRKNNKSGKIIRFLEGNVEDLPFRDCQFDCFISSLVIHLTPHPEKMINEAFRVLSKGGVAGFSLFGNLKECYNFINVYYENMEKFGITPKKISNPFDLGHNLDYLLETMKSAGFKGVKYAYTNVIYDVFEIQDFFTRIQLPFVTEWMANLTDEERSDFFLKITPIIEKQVIQSEKLPNLQGLIIIGFKE
jgi:ubiquinone/menaquinone biosynthesis C-methylase UbiE